MLSGEKAVQNCDADVYHIVATDEEGGIAKDGKIPWSVENDLFLFEKVTKGNTVIMGRETFETLSDVLSKRQNIVLTSKEYFNSKKDNLHFVEDMDTALNFACAENQHHDIFIIGGESVYEETFNDQILSGVYLALVEGGWKCDTFYPPFDELDLGEFKRVLELDTHATFFYREYSTKPYEVESDDPSLNRIF